MDVKRRGGSTQGKNFLSGISPVSLEVCEFEFKLQCCAESIVRDKLLLQEEFKYISLIHGSGKKEVGD